MADERVDHWHHSEPPGVRIELERGQRGAYGWSVKATAPTVAETLRLLAEADAQLRQQFGGEGQ